VLARAGTSGEKTAGLLPIEEVQKASADPFKLREGTSKPYDLHYSGSGCEAVIGGNRFTIEDNRCGTTMAQWSLMTSRSWASPLRMALAAASQSV
jgi:hypothetical protein